MTDDKVLIDLWHADICAIMNQVAFASHKGKADVLRDRQMQGVFMSCESVVGRKSKRLFATATNGNVIARTFMDAPRGDVWESLPDNYAIPTHFIQTMKTMSAQSASFFVNLYKSYYDCYGCQYGMRLTCSRPEDWKLPDLFYDVIDKAQANPYEIELLDAPSETASALEAAHQQVNKEGKAKFGSYYHKGNVKAEIAMLNDSLSVRAITKHGITDKGLLTSDSYEREFVYDEAKAQTLDVCVSIDDLITIMKRIKGKATLKVRDAESPIMVLDSDNPNIFYILANRKVV